MSENPQIPPTPDAKRAALAFLRELEIAAAKARAEARALRLSDLEGFEPEN